MGENLGQVAMRKYEGIEEWLSRERRAPLGSHGKVL